MNRKLKWIAAGATVVLCACGAKAPPTAAGTGADNTPALVQRGNGQPYELLGTQVWDVPDPVSRRTYQLFVSLPADYDRKADRRYPVLYVADADYAFPVIKEISHRLNGEGPKIRDFILVGLSYAKGESGMESRRRDYTPAGNRPTDAPPDAVFGAEPAYQAYLRRQVIPFVAQHFRTDEANRYFLGHSYGGLLGAQILFSDPTMFRGYILGSPSLWFGQHAILASERAYALGHKDLPADVYIYVGEYEDIRPGDPRFAKQYNMVTDVQTMARILRERHYPSLNLATEVLNDEDHLSIAPRGATHGLERFFAIHENGAAQP